MWDTHPMARLTPQAYYYVTVDNTWICAVCVKTPRGFGFQTHCGLMDSKNPALKILGLVPPPEGCEPQGDGPDTEVEAA